MTPGDCKRVQTLQVKSLARLDIHGFSQIGHSWVHGNKSLALKSRTSLAVFFQGQRKATPPLLKHVFGSSGACISAPPWCAHSISPCPSSRRPIGPVACSTSNRGGLASKLRSGEMSLHASRVRLTRESLNSALATVQKQLKLPTGINGGWTLEANAKLAYNLLQAERGRKGCGKETQPLCDLEDQRPQTSPPSTGLKRKKTQSSSSSSSSWSSASTSKSQLWRLIAEYEDAIGCHQDVEAEMEELRSERQPACHLTDRLGAEKKAALHGTLWQLFLKVVFTGLQLSNLETFETVSLLQAFWGLICSKFAVSFICNGFKIQDHIQDDRIFHTPCHEMNMNLGFWHYCKSN